MSKRLDEKMKSNLALQLISAFSNQNKALPESCSPEFSLFSFRDSATFANLHLPIVCIRKSATNFHHHSPFCFPLDLNQTQPSL